MNSALYEGRVYHRRHVPKPHAFAHRVFFLYLDLDELDEVFEGRWLWSTRRFAPARVRRSDYMQPGDRPLKDVVLDRVEAELGRRPGGAVRLLSQPRLWGYLFNPVSFYYCFDEQGALEAVAAEITNTPWMERHTYVLDARACAPEAVSGRDQGGVLGEPTEAIVARFAKDFHVSPFWPMEQGYTWRFSAPGDSLRIHMANAEGEDEVFHAGLAAERKPLSAARLAWVLARYAFQTHRVHAAIYLHALRLWLRRTPFFEHPDKRASVQDALPS